MRDKQRRVKGLMVGGMALVAAGLGIALLTPGKWWVETGVVGLVWFFLFLGIAWLSKSKIWGIKLSLGILVLLLLRRFGLLDPIMFGIWLGLLGLICLFN